MQWQWFSQIGDILTQVLVGDGEEGDGEREEKEREREEEKGNAAAAEEGGGEGEREGGRGRRKRVLTKEECEILGVNERLMEAVEGMCAHPSTWVSFPHLEMFTRLRLTLAQKRHARCALKMIPSLRKMRSSLCPKSITEREFWGVYFVLIGKLLPPHMAYHISHTKMKERRRSPFETESDDDDDVTKVDCDGQTVREAAEDIISQSAMMNRMILSAGGSDTDDITRFPISKYAQYFNATWHSWPVNVPYISRHPCLWVTEKTPILSDADVMEMTHSDNPVSEGVRREKEEWGREWEELARSERMRDYVHLPAHTGEELESLYSSPMLSKRKKQIVVVTLDEVSQIRRLIWMGGILPSKRGQIWIHLTDSWEFLNSIGLTEFDLHHEFLDHMHVVASPHPEIEDDSQAGVTPSGILHEDRIDQHCHVIHTDSFNPPSSSAALSPSHTSLSSPSPSSPSHLLPSTSSSSSSSSSSSNAPVSTISSNANIQNSAFDEYYSGVLLHVYGERAPSEVRALPVFGVGVFGHTNHSLSPTEVEAAYRVLVCLANRHPYIEYSPSLPDLVFLLFYILPEPAVYTIAHVLLLNTEYCAKVNEEETHEDGDGEEGEKGRGEKGGDPLGVAPSPPSLLAFDWLQANEGVSQSVPKSDSADTSPSLPLHSFLFSSDRWNHNRIALFLSHKSVWLFLITFESLVENHLPQVLSHLRTIGLNLSQIWKRWFMRWFVGVIPLRWCFVIADLVFLEGCHVLYSIGLSILYLKRDEILKIHSDNIMEKNLLSLQKFDFEKVLHHAKKFLFRRKDLRPIFLSNIMRWKRTTEDVAYIFKRPLHSPSSIVPSLLFEKILSCVPRRLHVQDPYLLYSSHRDGYNLRTFVAKNEGNDATILLLRTSTGKRFGAFLSKPWKISPNFYGNGETFVFSFETKEFAYHWSHGKKDFFMKLSKNSLVVGGGAIWLDEFFGSGRTSTSDTFGSPPLDGSLNDPISSSSSVSFSSYHPTEIESFGFRHSSSLAKVLL